VHGLGGDPKTTWGRFPELLREDPIIARRYAVASLGFPTAIWRYPFAQKAPKIQVLASHLKTQIDYRYKKYSDIVLICHSLGGIVAREYILEEFKEDRPLKVSGLLLFAVPNTGAELATVGQYVSWRHWQLKQLAKESDFLDSLNKDWLRTKVYDRLRLMFVDAMNDRVVKRDSAHLHLGNTDTATVPGTHRSLVKPTDANHDGFIVARDFLLGERGSSPAATDTPAAPVAVQAHDQIELVFNRDSLENYWYTYDPDDNRNIMRHDDRRRWSISRFQIMPRISSTYDLTVFAADAFAYNGHLQDWRKLEDRVQIGFPGPSVEKSVLDFQKNNPPFDYTTIPPRQSRVLKIPKIGQFTASLSEDFAFKESLWGGSELSYYALLYFVFHINTHYLFFTCLLPEESGYHKAAYFLGGPEILDTNDPRRFEDLAQNRLRSLQTLSRNERLVIPKRIR
jgi:predicted alpha/beta hydrolase family esterase